MTTFFLIISICFTFNYCKQSYKSHGDILWKITEETPEYIYGYLMKRIAGRKVKYLAFKNLHLKTVNKICGLFDFDTTHSFTFNAYKNLKTLRFHIRLRKNAIKIR